MNFEIHVDLDDIDDELARLGDTPGFKGVLALEGILTTQFQATQQQVHVDTRSLKNSGKMDSELGRHVWRGEITYGGESPGSYFNPVEYAAYEQERDGSHDFLKPAVTSDHLYAIVMMSILRGLD